MAPSEPRKDPGGLWPRVGRAPLARSELRRPAPFLTKRLPRPGGSCQFCNMPPENHGRRAVRRLLPLQAPAPSIWCDSRIAGLCGSCCSGGRLGARSSRIAQRGLGKTSQRLRYTGPGL